MKIGYFLSSEEWGPRELVAQAVKAQAAGFEGLWISDHFHPWNGEQGHSPFVWATIGAIANAIEMKVTTASPARPCCSIPQSSSNAVFTDLTRRRRRSPTGRTARVRELRRVLGGQISTAWRAIIADAPLGRGQPP